MNYTIYDKKTGRVVSHFSGPRDFLELNVKEGQGFVEGQIDYDCQMVVDGVVVPLPEDTVYDEMLEKESMRVKSQRASLLAASDWTQVPDSPVDKGSWADYRQSLRDITKQEGYPLNVIWPVPPNQ